MIIRSQDKKKIFILEQIRKINCETNSVIADDVSVMGTYSTEEKAIKVLDMICDACRNVAFTDGVVFQMPQNGEV